MAQMRFKLKSVKAIAFLIALVSFGANVHAQYLDVYQSEEVLKTFGIKYIYVGGNLTQPTLEGYYSIQSVPLDKAVTNANKIMNGRRLDPVIVSAWISQVLTGQCPEAGKGFLAGFTTADYCLKNSPKKTVDGLLQLIDGLSQVSPAVNFAEDGYLPNLILRMAKAFPSAEPSWMPYLSIVAEKLISKGQDIHQCGFMFALAKLGSLEQIDQYLNRGVDVDQVSCNGQNTPIRYALTGVESPMPGSYFIGSQLRDRNKEVVKLLYERGATLDSKDLKAYLSDDSMAASAVLPDLHKIKPLDINKLREMIFLTFPNQSELLRNPIRLKELADIGVDLKSDSLLWALAEVPNLSSEIGIEFSKVLLSAGADINEGKNGKSLVQYLTAAGKAKWVIYICNNGSTDPICKTN